MYEYVSDVLQALKISPEDVMLIRHVDSTKDEEHRFRKAQEAGYIKEYTAMQEKDFAKDQDYLMVFIKGEKTTAKFFALYYISNRFPSREGHIPADYPNPKEVQEEGDYLELREIALPHGLEEFIIEWGNGIRFDQLAKNEKRIIEITSSE